MKTISQLTLATLLAVSFTSVAGGKFTKLDKDTDGNLTVKEFIGKAKGKAQAKKEKNFKKLDKNSDGLLSAEEFAAGAKKKK